MDNHQLDLVVLGDLGAAAFVVAAELGCRDAAEAAVRSVKDWASCAHCSVARHIETVTVAPGWWDNACDYRCVSPRSHLQIVVEKFQHLAESVHLADHTQTHSNSDRHSSVDLKCSRMSNRSQQMSCRQ